MIIKEYGCIKNKKILLIHGFQSPYQVWDKYVQNLEKDYHVIVPIMSGHFPSSDQDFISFEQESKYLEDFLLAKGYQDFELIFGMSMGGVLTAKLWDNNRLNFKNIVFDGSPLARSNS